MPPVLNKNHSGVKRIMQEARELSADDSTEYSAAPLEDDIFEWHGTLRGPAGTEYEGGLYHFRILLPAEYPFRPPAIQLLTPNGRFELNTNICISFTNYHEESWQPAWGVRTAIIGLQGFFPLNGKDAVGVGGIEYPAPERRRLAKLSHDWTCHKCGQRNIEQLPDPGSSSSVKHASESDATRVVTLPSVPAHTEHQQEITPNVASTGRDDDVPSHPPAPTPVTPTPTMTLARNIATASRKPTRPPVILDTAICILLVLASALICRRVL